MSFLDSRDRSDVTVLLFSDKTSFYFNIPMSKKKRRFDYFCKCLKLKVSTPCLDLNYSIPKMANSLKNYFTFTVNLLFYPVYRNNHHHICLPFISHRCYLQEEMTWGIFWTSLCSLLLFHLFATMGASISCPVTAEFFQTAAWFVFKTIRLQKPSHKRFD